MLTVGQPGLEKPMGFVREIAKTMTAATMAAAMLGAPLCAAPTSELGVVVYADHARVGLAAASVGSTVFGGDELSTEPSGSVQIREGAARFLLASGGVATLSTDSAEPGATLTSGTATFSTASAKAFTLHFAEAAIRPNTDEPTVGQASVLGPRELIVKSTRGALAFTIAGETRVIPEGMAFRVILDPTPAEAAAASSAGGRSSQGGPPATAGSSKFVWYAIGVVAVVTALAIHAALESPDRP
jgi:hypothetical protein